MTNKLIDDIRNNLDDGKINSEKLFEEARNKAIKYQDEYNSFVTILDKKEEVSSNSILSGIPYALKDNISTKGILTTGSSNILKDYIPLYDATVYKKLKEAGAVLVGKTVLDELAMGGTGTTGHTGVVRNPWDKTRMIGGSSAGSAASVALGIVPFSIGSDTGDSIRKPAAYGGIVGYKPTYGRVSRYGLFAFASSLDHVGVFSRCVRDTAYVMDIIKGHDNKDMTSLPDENISYVNNLSNDVKGKKLFYIKELIDEENYPNMNDELKKHLEIYHETIKKLEEIGASVTGVSIDKKILNALPSVYVVLSCAEATSNMSNLTGFIFGPREDGKNYIEMMKNYRTKNFSSLIKRRFIIGSYVLQKENQERYFINAQRVRRLIVDIMKDYFEEYDAMIMPVGVGAAKHIDGSLDMIDKNTSVLDEFLQVGNFGGFPSITIPDGFIDNLPVGVNITGNCYDDQNVLNIAYALESVMPYKNQIAKEVNHE